MERRFIFARSPRQEERISLHYITIEQQRRVLKSVEPPRYRFRDLADLGHVHRDVQGLVALLASARKHFVYSRGLLLIEPTGKRIKQLARAMAGEAGAPLTIVFCSVLAEIWQESIANEQPTTILRELFLSLRLLSSSLIYLEDLDTLASIDEDEQQGHNQLFWAMFLEEIDKLLAQPGVVLLVATRKLEVLPPELLTPTRLGQGLVVDAPAAIEASERQPARVATGKKGQQPSGLVSHLLCPACRQPIQGHWLHCVYCGVSVARTCPKCGSPTPEIPGARFCFHCGHQLM